MAWILKPTLTEIFLERCRVTPEAAAFFYRDQTRQWQVLNYREVYQQCREIALGLESLGIERGDRVALLSHSRPEWSIIDLAILGAGGVTVPIYPSSSAADCSHVLADSGSRYLFVESTSLLQKVLDQRIQTPGLLARLERIIVLDPAALSIAAGQSDVLSLTTVREQGALRCAPGEADRFEPGLLTARPDDLATICYTSGTTGRPKGVMLSHDNLVSVLEDAVELFGDILRENEERVLTFLPFSHVMGRIESIATYVFGWKQYFAESLDRLSTNMTEVKPTLLFAVPRIFEKAYHQICTEVESSNALSARLLVQAIESGHRLRDARSARGRAPLKDRIRYQLSRPSVLRRIRSAFGGELRFAICGGSPIAQEITEFFEIAGIRILEGYGLTETSAPITLNLPDSPRFGTVGRPLPEVAVRISEDGEILVKSRKVFCGYYGMEEETARVIRDGGWFHTGDLGYLDREGYLHLTDRKADLLPLPHDRVVAPQRIENLARTFPLISGFVLDTDEEDRLIAFITLEKDAVIRFASQNHILFSGYRELTRHPRIQAIVQDMVDQINAGLADFETIQGFEVLPAEFSIESGELTPSLKIRRDVVRQRHRPLTAPAKLDS